MTLPEWYLNSNPVCTSNPAGSRRLRALVRQGLDSLTELLAREVSSQKAEDCWLRNIEPCAKILGIFVLIFGMTFLQGLLPLALLLALAIALIISARIRLGRLIRLWIGVPLFSLAIVIPATTNFVTPGSSLITIWHFGPNATLWKWPLPEVLAITDSGIIVAARFLLRTMDAVNLVFVLVATTDHPKLIGGLRQLGMPRVFGMVLAMAQRYLAVLLRVAEEIHLAKLSRTICPQSLRQEQRWVASGIANLFRRTHSLAQEIHNAMLSRGFDGEVRILSKRQMRLPDVIWLVGAMLLLAGLIISDRIAF